MQTSHDLHSKLKRLLQRDNFTCNFPTFVFLLLGETRGGACPGTFDPYRGDEEVGSGAYVQNTNIPL
jgi:hypothetical protein